MKMRWIGHRLHAGVDPALSLASAPTIAHTAEHALISAAPRLTTGLVHAYHEIRSPRRGSAPLAGIAGTPASSHSPHGPLEPSLVVGNNCDS